MELHRVSWQRGGEACYSKWGERIFAGGIEGCGADGTAEEGLVWIWQMI